MFIQNSILDNHPGNRKTSVGDRKARNKEISDSLADRFKAALDEMSHPQRKEAHLLQKELADEMGLSQSGFSHLLGKRMPFDMYQAHYLAERLNVDISDLLPRFKLRITEPPSASTPVVPLDKELVIECFKFVESHFAKRKQPRSPESIAVLAVKMLESMRLNDITLSMDVNERSQQLLEALIDALSAAAIF